MEVAQMILIDVSGANAIVRKQDTLTSGMVGATVVFRFDEDWNSLAKTAVFRAGRVTKDAIVVDSMSEIPHEVLATHGYALEIGVYGTADDGAVVIPTIWAKTNPIKLGTDPSGDESLDPSLPVWAQMQEQLDSMYRSSGEIKAAKEELMQAIEDAKEDLDDIVAAGGYYSKVESGTKLASAIHGKLSGSIVAADDVSPAEHFLSVKAHGKNLGPSTVTVYRYGKNLIRYPFAYTTRTTNGVTFTPKADGTIGVNGTATANTYFALNGGFSVDAAQIPNTLKPGVEYTITDAMLFLYKDGETKAFNEGTFTMPEGYDYYGIFVYIPSGTTVAEIRRPQLEVGGKTTDFEPYTSARYVPLADGTVEGVTSLAPCVTLTADRDDILLQVEYNRDTNRVIEELLNTLSPAVRFSSIKLLASKWNGSGSLYSQVVSIAGITENSQVNLVPTVEQLSIFYDKDVTFVTENDGGVVTVYVIGQKPQNDYTIPANIVEVNT